MEVDTEEGLVRFGAKGEALIKSFESLRLSSYLDQRGYATIGWGHRGWYSADVPVALGQTCTAEQAEDWFQRDTQEAVNAVSRGLDVAVSQDKFDALVSFAFNCGITAFAHSTLLRDLNEGLVQSAANEFLKWDYCAGVPDPGLERRRKAERDLFLTPTEPST